jgi:hypothetical protein
MKGKRVRETTYQVKRKRRKQKANTPRKAKEGLKQ